MSIKPAIQNLIQEHRSLAQQLHDLRISKNKTLEDVNLATKIPEHIIDAQETGTAYLNMPVVFQLAKYYGKKVKIDLVDAGSI